MVGLNKKTISASSLATYLKCGYRYFLQYEAQEETIRGKPSPPMVAGTGFHATLEYAIKECLKGNEPTVASCAAIGMAAANNEFKEKGIDFDSISTSDPSEELDSILARVKKASRFYLENFFDELFPLEAETQFHVAIPDTDWHLTGKIDLLEQDGSVTDFKLTGSNRKPQQTRADQSEQLSIYALARLLETGSVPPQLSLDITRDLMKRPQRDRLFTFRSEKDCEKTLTRVRHVVSCIEAGVYPIASHEGIECNGSRCQFWAKCPYGGK